MGYYIVFRWNQHIVKEEMISQLRMGIYHPDVVVLKILHPEREKQFRRTEKNEFTFYGRLYDIVVERKSGDTVFFYCLHDKKEESLVAGFTQWSMFYGHPAPSKKGHPMHALLHNLITDALVQQPLSLNQSNEIKVAFPVLRPRLTPGFLFDFKPPPEIA
jgi:hypothetical protein